VGTHAGKSSQNSDGAWWRSEVIYEIAAISFQDSNGDGRGDLPGLLQRIEYLTWLGIGAVWLTPIYNSPNHDFGYDIADFCSVDLPVSVRSKISIKSRELCMVLGSGSFSTWSPIIHPTSTFGLEKAAPRETTRKLTGISGRQPAPMVARRTIGSAASVVVPGGGPMSARSSITIRFCRASRI
jgi:hypothetical protein